MDGSRDGVTYQLFDMLSVFGSRFKGMIRLRPEHVWTCNVTRHQRRSFLFIFNPLTPKDHYSGRTAPLTSKRCILYIHSTNIGTEYFKHGIYSPFFPLQNAVCFIILTYLVSCVIYILYTGCAKIKKNYSGAKRLTTALPRSADSCLYETR